MRWRIEKSFDELKNKLYEQKAWAKSNEAKEMQALFSTLAYNLAKLLNAKIENEDGIKDSKNERKKQSHLNNLLDKSIELGTHVPSLRKEFQKASQLSVKFYRWLRVYMLDPSSWRVSLSQLERVYSNF